MLDYFDSRFGEQLTLLPETESEEPDKEVQTELDLSDPDKMPELAFWDLSAIRKPP